MSKTYFGVDISEHNGTVDWKKVAKKVDFAILRICWVGNEKYKMDVNFEANYKAAKEAGVKLGGYVYMYSKSATAAEKGAKWTIEQLKGKKFDLPIYCDMEDPTINSFSKTALTTIAEAFNKAIKKGGYAPGIYASRYWFDNKLDKSMRLYPTWIAHYTSGTNKYKGEYDMWQNSSEGKVDGVKGNVDTNYLYEDIFIKSIEPKPKTPTKKTVDELAKEVLAGKWGNGDERKKKLTAAGYNYDAVQKKVNELSSTTTKKKVTYKTKIGKRYRLKVDTTLYENGNLTGKKYQYLKNTEIEVINHYSEKVDKIKAIKTGRVAHCKVSDFV